MDGGTRGNSGRPAGAAKLPAALHPGNRHRESSGVEVLKKWLTTREAAAYLGVAVSSLEKWRQRSIGPEFSRLGPRTIRYSVDALSAYQVDKIVRPER
jgi:hypothetical protein